jgi:hypothetical protein
LVGHRFIAVPLEVIPRIQKNPAKKEKAPVISVTRRLGLEEEADAGLLAVFVIFQPLIN